ncbi:MAG: histidine kinase [Rhodovulum sulfidophilum]|uniref:histidine kinase n=1 Tax=Rhodovulum sulfidophilum TaxID=35806 RepID=A0A2W5MZG5_RHOSU|nr:MAG: histidine kinase [Rhodovulum sulfidophilum]
MSLRRATIATLVALLTLVGVLAGAASYWIAAREANEFLDLQLEQVARLVGDTGPAGVQLPPHDSEDDLVIEVRFHDGRDPVCAAAPCLFPAAPAAGFTDLRAGGHAWRVFALDRPDRLVQIGQRREVRREMASGAALAAILPILVAIPVLWVVVDTVLRRAFRRLARVTADIAARDASDVAPIETRHVPSEMRPLVLAMNGLLERLRGLMDQQRAFVADAAHQLRTPLAALTLEVGNLRAGGEEGLPRARLAFVEAAARRASALVGQLLRLARQEAGSPRPRAAVRLDAVVRETIEALTPLAIARRVDLGLTERIEASAPGDHEDFRVLLETLIDNAVRYTPEGGTVDVEMRRAPGGGIVVTVRDDGPGIPPEALPRVFERFFRVEGQEAEGSGLGLAIAELIAARHGLSLAIANRADAGGAEARVTFPAA